MMFSTYSIIVCSMIQNGWCSAFVLWVAIISKFIARPHKVATKDCIILNPTISIQEYLLNDDVPFLWTKFIYRSNEFPNTCLSLNVSLLLELVNSQWLPQSLVGYPLLHKLFWCNLDNLILLISFRYAFLMQWTVLSCTRQSREMGSSCCCHGDKYIMQSVVVLMDCNWMWNKYVNYTQNYNNLTLS